MSKRGNDIFSLHNSLQDQKRIFEEFQVMLNGINNTCDCEVLEKPSKIPNLDLFRMVEYDIIYQKSDFNKNNGIVVYIKKQNYTKVVEEVFSPINEYIKVGNNNGKSSAAAPIQMAFFICFFILIKIRNIPQAGNTYLYCLNNSYESFSKKISSA